MIKNRNKLFILITLFILIGAFTLLRFGNPQWSRVIYLYQLSQTNDPYLRPDINYSGKWIDWKSIFQMEFMSEYQNGILLSRIFYYKSKKFSTSKYYKNGIIKETIIYSLDGGKDNVERYDKEGKLIVSKPSKKNRTKMLPSTM